MKLHEVAYISWAKSQPEVEINLTRSGVEVCPPSILGLTISDLVTNLPATYGYEPLRHAIAERYCATTQQVFPLSGGTSYANWIACAAILNGADPSTEVIVERPTYEPLLRIPQALGHTIRRLDRREEDNFALDLDRLEALLSPRTRLAIISNLHNPSGVQVDHEILRAAAGVLDRVGAYLLVDEVYLECLLCERPESAAHAGPNVVATNSLTKAYGLDGLRAGWILGPASLVKQAGRINDLMANNSVAPGEQMALAAFQRMDGLLQRARSMLDRNRDVTRSFVLNEPRLRATPSPGGTFLFARLPDGIDDQRLTSHLVTRYSTLVVPGSFFESPGTIRIGTTADPNLLRRGLANISAALDDLTRGGAPPR
jgi:aspartate/methionine/tyrosine aminotransferase